AERRNGDFVRGLIEQGKVTASHDCADGGLLITLTEMAISSGIGATIEIGAEVTGSLPAHAYLFGEDQGRYVLTVPAVQAGAAFAPPAATGWNSVSMAQLRSMPSRQPTKPSSRA